MTEDLLLVCPHCREVFDYDPAYQGQKIGCEGCGAKFLADENLFRRTLADVSDSAAEPIKAESAPVVLEAGQVEARCPECGYAAAVPEALIGKSVKCPVCQKVFRVNSFGGFELVEPEGAPAAETPPEKPKALGSALITFEKDDGPDNVVTLSYQELVRMVKFGGKPFPKFATKTVRGALGETLSVPIKEPTKVHFEIGRLCGRGNALVQPGASYLVKRSATTGGWQVVKLEGN